MGNSGSIHNVAIDLDDNQYPHSYNQQFQENFLHQQNSQYPIHWTPSYTSNGSSPRSQPQVKVLPEPSTLSRLRPTTNGTILQSGGTISGRREVGNSTLLLHRSRTTLIESPGNFRRTASGHNAERIIESRKFSKQSPLSGAPGKPVNLDAKDKSVGIKKRSGSEPDLRGNLEYNGNNGFVGNNRLPSPSKSKIVKSKKKMTAPMPTPVDNIENKPAQTSNVQPKRKLRLFKTRAESRKNIERATTSNVKIATDNSDYHFRHVNASERLSSSQRQGLLGKIKPEPDKREEITQAKSNLPIFRREKSFDITLLRNRNRDTKPSGNAVVAPLSPNKFSASQRTPASKVETTSSCHQNAVQDAKTRSQRNSFQPSSGLEGDQNFKIELEAATKRRSIAALEDTQRQNQVKNQKTSSSHKLNKDSNKIPLGTRSSESESTKEVSRQKSSQQGIDSKINQLTKTFYFGMEKPSVDLNGNGNSDSVSNNQMNENDNFAKIQMEVIDQFAKSIFTTPEYERAESESSESALSSEEACHMMPRIDCASQEEENDAQIQVHVRPTLPRKQLEIPRFSPAAAWRMLNEDRFFTGCHHGGSDGITNGSMVQSPQPVQPLEGRIQRIYREPNPMYPDNKSGDSGISGDAGLPERVDSPRHQRLTSIVGPFLTAWTPQQDLDEEDDATSSDDELSKDAAALSHGQGHTFSLSLPRENQLSIYEEKEKPGFSSLKKLKRTVSGVFANQTNGNRLSGSYRNDNWLLSRSAPNSIDNSQISPTLGNATNAQDSTNHSSSTLSYLTAGRHIMYLPNQPTEGMEQVDFKSMPLSLNISTKSQTREDTSFKDIRARNIYTNSPQEVMEIESLPVAVQDTPKTTHLNSEESTKVTSKKIRGGHRFTFQSTVRQIERRRIADKLSKEAEQKEAQRISELEAMRRVEEEFQRKRAGEKASIRHQLRLFSLEENQCTSLPVDWQNMQGGNNNNFLHMDNLPYRNNSNQQRAEPDGAVSPSPAASPIPRSHSKLSPVPKDRRLSTAVNNSMAQLHYIKKDETKSRLSLRPRQQKHPLPQTDVLSEFRTPRREYFEYRSLHGTSSTFRQQCDQQRTEHNEVVCNIPMKSAGKQQQTNDRFYQSEVNGDLCDSRFFSDSSYN